MHISSTHTQNANTPTTPSILLNSVPSVDEPLKEQQKKDKAAKYTECVQQFATLPDGRGANYKFLADLLSKSLSHAASAYSPANVPEHSSDQLFAVSYAIGEDDSPKLSGNDARLSRNFLKPPQNDSKPVPTEMKWTLNKAVQYSSCAGFIHKIDSKAAKCLGKLLFLRGYPSAEWLASIGGILRVDPEFFVRFLNFMPAKDTKFNYSLPALPVATWNMLEIPIITIGQRPVTPGRVDQVEVDEMRREAKSNLQSHHDRLRSYTGIDLASSIVRNVAIIDDSCFALEQSVWICLQHPKRKDLDQPKWILMIWTDTGGKPSVKSVLELNVLPSKFNKTGTHLEPVINYKPNTGLASVKIRDQGHVIPDDGAEAASQLWTGYGQTLNHQVMATDPLYALTELFNIATASVNQYLNLIEHKLLGFTDDVHYADFDMLSNLRYSKDILYRQQRQLEQVTTWLKFHKLQGGTGWRTTSEEASAASEAAQNVIQRYEHLQGRVATLQAQCQDAISNLMNNINLEEVKNSFQQSQRTAKLSLLAILFAPLSFSTSFFSMDIGLENLSLNTWLVVTFVLLLITILFMVVDFDARAQRLRLGLQRMKQKAGY